MNTLNTDKMDEIAERFRIALMDLQHANLIMSSVRGTDTYDPEALNSAETLLDEANDELSKILEVIDQQPTALKGDE